MGKKSVQSGRRLKAVPKTRRRSVGMRRPSLLMALEPRIMFDGAGAATAVDATADAAAAEAIDQIPTTDKAQNDSSSTSNDNTAQDATVTDIPGVTGQESTSANTDDTAPPESSPDNTFPNDTQPEFAAEQKATDNDKHTPSASDIDGEADPFESQWETLELTSSTTTADSVPVDTDADVDTSFDTEDLIADTESVVGSDAATIGSDDTSLALEETEVQESSAGDHERHVDDTNTSTETQAAVPGETVTDDPAVVAYTPPKTGVREVIIIDSAVADYESLVQGIIKESNSVDPNSDTVDRVLDTGGGTGVSVEMSYTDNPNPTGNTDNITTPNTHHKTQDPTPLDLGDGHIVLGDVEIFLIDSDQDGIEQITDILDGFQGLAGVHIVSHGTNGSVKVGNTWLRSGNLDTYTNDIANWKEAFSEGGDLLLYGCDLAATAEGRQLVDNIAELTGTDVAASTDDTGHRTLGGDWQLEYHTSAIETAVGFSMQVQQDWSNLLANFVVTSTADSGAGSFRQAIIDANALPGLDTISFNISAPLVNGAHTISLASALPDITDTITIDGTTEPDYAGTPIVELDGAGAGATTDGLRLVVGSDGSTIRGLSIQNFSYNGILLQSDNNTVAGNYIGLDADGATVAGNNTSGLGVQGGIRIESAGNTIGGLNAADRNVVSGNVFSGIAITGASATGNQVIGNYIGTDASGTLDRGNTQEGIEIDGANSNTIGGLSADARNIISGNDSDGIEIDNADFNVVQGNYIGTDVTGTLDLGNSRDGIDLNENTGDGATGNLIGGTDPNAGNLIAGNDMNGIEVRDAPTIDNPILGNRIYDNSLLGINLGLMNDGVTANDLDDGDAGANDLQNFPVLTAANTNGVDSITVDGSINSTANTTFRIEFFSNTVSTGQDPSLHGEGENYLGFTTVTTDAGGDAVFSAPLSASVVVGEFVSATATEDLGGGNYGSTSEFALNVVAADPNDPPVITSDGAGPTASVNVTENQTAVTDVDATDADIPADTLTYSIIGGTDATSFAIDSNSGVLTFTAAPNFEVPLDADGDGVYQVEVEVDDGNGGIDTQLIDVTVTDQNDIPVANDDPGAYSTDVLALNPTSYWRLGESAGTNVTDSGSAGVTGTYVGPTLGENDPINGDPDTAVGFNRTDPDYIEIPHDNAYLLDEGTIQLWFNADDLAQDQGLFSKDSNMLDTGGHLTIRLLTDGSLQVRLQSTTTSYLVNSAPGTVTAGNWQHAAFSFGTDGMQLYLNGNRVDTNPYTGGTGATSGGAGNFEPIAIGANAWVSGDGTVNPLVEHFDGRIDEVAIFGTQLSASDINRLSGGAAQNYTLDEDTSLSVPTNEGVLVNDFDDDGDALTAALVSGPSNAASFTFNPDGSFDYTPLANFNGTDTFTYRANDGSNDSNIATVTITVNPIDDPPLISDATTSVPEDAVNTTPVFNVNDTNTGSDTDVDSDAITYSITAGNTDGIFGIDSNTGQITVVDNTNLDFESTTQYV
ncbi:MAG: DUF4347 domain-containing protein, partial [Arenicellales bacterium]|nr:DUF4347 domain-containing protein [Arenicellales bacterium]